MRSPIIHQFSQAPKAYLERSCFRRPHSFKTTMDAGYLVPIYVDEVLPGDTFKVNAALFGRFATPIVPIMDNVYLETFFFAVPYRLIWDNWERFCGAQDNPGDSIDYLIPSMTAPANTGFEVGSLSDYFGIPTGVPGLEVDSLWHRAYNLVWNEWFRNENLQNSVPVPKGDGPDNPADFKLLRRCKRKDYFTAALPWPQKGPAVDLPLGGFAPVVTREDGAFGIGSDAWPPEGGSMVGLKWSTSSGEQYMLKSLLGLNASPYPGQTQPYDAGDLDPKSGRIAPRNLWADLSNATAATINSVRQAFAIQRFMERQGLGGSRYIELIRSFFGVVSPDYRLQRPEYLGGGSEQIHFYPVQQTSATGDVTPQGNLAAYGTVGGTGHGFTKSFTEHCLIIGLANIRADLTYQQGLPRMFSRRTRFDFYWPQFAHLGEQTILNKEIYAQGPAAVDTYGNQVDEQVFGYQERYAEYRYYPSKITGKFRSTDPQSLDVWHLSQKFANLPVLGPQFIEDNPPVERVIAVQDEPQLLLDVFFDNVATRPMPMYGTPGLVDHF